MGDVHCTEAAERSTDYLDGTLTPEERQRFERHLAGCAACRAALRQLRTLLVLARRLPAPTLSPAAREQLVATFRARHGRHQRKGRNARTFS